jgi:lysophospholipase L1-like esterase
MNMQKLRLGLCVTVLLSLTGFAQTPPRGEPTNANEAALQKKYGDKLKPKTYAAYQQLVAALPADEQAWEKVLEDQLGGFYFPFHVSDRLAKKETAWSFVKDNPALPRVLLIGDSISRSYTMDVRHTLAGKANVHRAPANCGSTDSGLKNMPVWLGSGKWDVIVFNFAIHDRAKKPELYAANLEKVISLLEKTGAKLVWARTTPFQGKGSKNVDDSPALNTASDEVMKQHGIPVIDLHAAVSGVVATARSADHCHFNEAGIKLLAAEVVKTIEPLLKK